MKKKIVKIIITIFKYLLLIILSMILFISFYINDSFNNIPFEQLLFTLKYSSGTSVDAISDGIIYVVIRLIILTIVILLIKCIVLLNCIQLHNNYNNKCDLWSL